MTHAAAPTLGIGMLGYAFMGKAHAHAYRTLAHLTDPPPLRPRLIAVAGRDEGAVAEAAGRYGFDGHATDWRALVADERIGLFDNSGPNHLHAEPTIAAAEAGKHVVCEKPLGRDADESFEIWRRVAATGVTHLCAFNYRFVPALRLARELIEAGELGEIRHFRGRYLQEWVADAEHPHVWRLDRELAGSGALGDLGAHVVDLAHYLVGDLATVTAMTKTFVYERPGGVVDVDDAFAAVAEFAGGAVGTIECSRFATGHSNGLRIEIDGSAGAIAFDLERINELEVHLPASGRVPGAQGFRRVLVTEPHHPFAAHWWPPGHVIGWEHTFVHELHHLLSAIADGGRVRPHGADFEDGYRAAAVCEAIGRSARSGAAEAIGYRTLEE